MLTKVEVQKLLDKAISDHDLVIYQKMAQAISDNNIKLFNVLARREAIKESYVTKEQLQETVSNLQNTMDKMYGLLKKHDQEQTVMSHQVNSHESRISKLEVALT
ncbi:MAG: hypothetical protein UX08_C0011G0021 [Candidatus Collierbacteria bacterium GW2011_GWB1_45_35]|uniref:Uncharacterized protein n=1 Tax=Candidatus Collierbacteria bacterium GW2011_GWB2_45_17 TaxID=1618388 RepID=A0A837IE21_9BACT|nr:MAG: hypothetical protein UW48_C0010G0034 [Microgenomates group bacterium GW2011_GWC1_44_23]KKT94852.1 MAG: hypothetical protein UW96_C0014G0021 [Candidatus Collierbacteria bacterium GW2011_GWA1_45_15]KKT99680.1 MAG: hypothetical protein UX01_C0008G0048 [Candidatus Collierbacteria bacterium GW2011_GWB2_45_17]KKU05095.1 MAG: hypothetical protein UX08_C0011G0021 [Candidatus Collierbacteria bacterium GW2011_GWB1_45_35]KKU07189.1 MAG: hypothetical protein UX11_C0019G0029 [Candidatus Collierbacte